MSVVCCQASCLPPPVLGTQGDTRGGAGLRGGAGARLFTLLISVDCLHTCSTRLQSVGGGAVPAWVARSCLLLRAGAAGGGANILAGLITRLGNPPTAVIILESQCQTKRW